jgi:hypothetical protein
MIQAPRKITNKPQVSIQKEAMEIRTKINEI